MSLARSFLSGSEKGTEGATEVGRVMGLYPDAACSTEAADEAFAAEDGGDPAFASLGELEGGVSSKATMCPVSTM